MVEKFRPYSISCISAASYAYSIKSSLRVENNTDVPMVITVGDLPFQKSKPTRIAPHDFSNVDLTIGGWEPNKYYSARLDIKSDDDEQKLFVQGRVDYYVGFSSYQNNSLDSVTAAEGLSIDATYSCFPRDSNISPFVNKIVISGEPDKAGANSNIAELHCQGFKSLF